MKKAVLIGINYYSIPDIILNGCINDIINVNNMLIDAYDYDMNNITMIRDDLMFIQPTRDNIIRYLKLLVSESSQLEEIWIHYSGHGSRINNKVPDSIDKMDEVLVPIDYETNGFIIDDELLDIIKETKCRTILVMDCCHSASMFDLPWSFEYDISNNLIRREHINRNIIANNNIFMFSGSKDKQTSADTYNTITEQYAGALTNAFIACLRIKKHNVSFLQLYIDIYQYLVAGGFSQKPIFSSSSENPNWNIVRAIPNCVEKTENINIKTVILQNMKSVIRM